MPEPLPGSKYLVEHENHKVLVDCGLFQGFKALRLKNWAPFPVEPRSIDAVILTHAHLDHSGYLPLLIKRGFRGPVYCSRATVELCAILLPDAGHLQEKDAEFANRHGFSKHKPALPLYTLEDAQAALEHLTPIPFDQDQALPGGGAVRLRRAGHILGAASVQLDWAGTTTVFSGDLGRYDDPIMVDPVSIERADYLLVESTYGNRRHDARDPAEVLAEIVGDHDRPRRNGGHSGLRGRTGPKSAVSLPPVEIEGIAVNRSDLPRQPDGGGRQRDLLPQHRGP